MLDTKNDNYNKLTEETNELERKLQQECAVTQEWIEKRKKLLLDDFQPDMDTYLTCYYNVLIQKYNELTFVKDALKKYGTDEP